MTELPQAQEEESGAITSTPELLQVSQCLPSKCLSLSAEQWHLRGDAECVPGDWRELPDLRLSTGRVSESDGALKLPCQVRVSRAGWTAATLVAHTVLHVRKVLITHTHNGDDVR